MIEVSTSDTDRCRTGSGVRECGSHFGASEYGVCAGHLYTDLASITNWLLEAGDTRVDLWIGFGGGAHVQQVSSLLQPRAFVPHHWDDYWTPIADGPGGAFPRATLDSILATAGTTLLVPLQYFDAIRISRRGATLIDGAALRTDLDNRGIGRVSCSYLECLGNTAERADSMNDWLHGTLETLILNTLARGPRHGYAIARWIEDQSGDAIRVEEGSLYPALYRLERKGWVRAEWGRSELGRRAKFYRLTPVGRKRLKQDAAAWSRFADGVARVLGAREGA